MGVKQIIKKVVPQSLVNSLVQLYKKPYIMNKSPKEREEILRKAYYRATGKTIDFGNVKTFNEKIQWLKLYWDHPDLSKVVCKYNFKQYIAEKIGSEYTIDLLGVYSTIEEIDWNALPNQFVLKSNSSGDGVGVKIIRDKSACDIDELKKEMAEWLKPRQTLINSFCRAYYDVTPLIVAEKYVEQENGQLYDYKFFCFNGKPEFAYVAIDHFSEEGKLGEPSKISCYSLDWERMDVRYGNHKQNNVPAPKRLKDMIEISEKLSREFPFVRVDFFEVNDDIFVSELTFYPGGGFAQLSDEIQKCWGDKLKLPRKRVFKRKIRKDLI